MDSTSLCPNPCWLSGNDHKVLKERPFGFGGRRDVLANHELDGSLRGFFHRLSSQFAAPGGAKRWTSCRRCSANSCRPLRTEPFVGSWGGGMAPHIPLDMCVFSDFVGFPSLCLGYVAFTVPRPQSENHMHPPKLI